MNANILNRNIEGNFISDIERLRYWDIGILGYWMAKALCVLLCLCGYFPFFFTTIGTVGHNRRTWVCLFWELSVEHE